MLTLFFITFALWTALHAYVAVRLVAPLSLRPAGRAVMYGLAALLAGASPLVLFADMMLQAPYTSVYRWVGWVYIGAFSTLFALVFVRDAVWWALLLVD